MDYFRIPHKTPWLPPLPPKFEQVIAFQFSRQLRAKSIILYKLETKLLSWEYTVLPAAFKNNSLSKLGGGGGGGGEQSVPWGIIK